MFIQTNMLAVKGSIEAARAGEFDESFVVLATRIRNPAHDSAEKTDRIKGVVKAAQDIAYCRACATTDGSPQNSLLASRFASTPRKPVARQTLRSLRRTSSKTLLNQPSGGVVSP